MAKEKKRRAIGEWAYVGMCHVSRRQYWEGTSDRGMHYPRHNESDWGQAVNPWILEQQSPERKYWRSGEWHVPNVLDGYGFIAAPPSIMFTLNFSLNTIATAKSRSQSTSHQTLYTGDPSFPAEQNWKVIWLEQHSMTCLGKHYPDSSSHYHFIPRPRRVISHTLAKLKDQILA